MIRFEGERMISSDLQDMADVVGGAYQGSIRVRAKLTDLATTEMVPLDVQIQSYLADRCSNRRKLPRDIQSDEFGIRRLHVD